MYSKQRMKLLEVALDFVPEPIFAIDLDKKVILWNKAMEELFGVERKQIMKYRHRPSAFQVKK